MGIERRGDKWRAKVTLPDRTQRARHFRTKAEAVRWEAEQKTAMNRGNYVDPSERTTVTEYAKLWASRRPYRPTTARNVDSLIRNHIESQPLGNRRVGAVRPSEVQAWATSRSKVMSPLRLRNLVGLLRTIYRDAVLDRLAAENPVMRVQLPRYEQPRVVPLSVEQVKALVDAMPPRCKAMVIVQAGAGLRIGEVIALRVEDVDFLRRTIRVQWQFAPQSKIRTETKTPRSRRTIPVPAFVTDAIADHLRQWPAMDDGTIFTNRQGAPFRHDWYGSIIFQKAVKAAGLPAGTTTHDLRHSYASVLLAAGEAVTTVADRLGHSSPAITLGTYGHMMPGKDDGTRKAVEDAWTRSAAPQRTRDHPASS